MPIDGAGLPARVIHPRLAGGGARRAGVRNGRTRNGAPRLIGGDMDKSADERGNTGPTDGIKTKGDAGNERHACKANPATTDGIGKKHGTEDMSESFSGEKCALAPKAAATKFPKASRCYVALGKARRVLWWLGLLLLSPALILWAEWGANGDDDTIICRVLTFSSSSCMNLTTATEYVRRLTLVLIMGVVCWIAALVIFGVRSYMRSVYPELRDHSSSASHVLVGIISFLVLVMVFPVLVITLLSALMTL